MSNVMQPSGQITRVNEIGKRVRARRNAMNLTQAQLAARAGITQGAVGNFETGARQNPRALLALARALAVSPQWLESGRGSPDDPSPPPAPSAAEDHPVAYAVEVLAHALDAMETPGRDQVEQLLQTLARAPDSAKAKAALVSALETEADHERAPPKSRSGNATGTDG